MHDSDTWMAMAQTDGFCVNVLRNTQAELCWRFAKRGNEDARFDGLAWQPAPVTGSPVIDGVGAWIDCAIERTHRARRPSSSSSAPCGPSITTPRRTSRSCSTRVRSAGSPPTTG